jgi:hypothetical protein
MAPLKRKRTAGKRKSYVKTKRPAMVLVSL